MRPIDILTQLCMLSDHVRCMYFSLIETTSLNENIIPISASQLRILTSYSSIDTPVSTIFSKKLPNIRLLEAHKVYRLFPSHLGYQSSRNIEALYLHKVPMLSASLEKMILVPGSVRGSMIEIGSRGGGRKDGEGRKDYEEAKAHVVPCIGH